MHALVVIAHPEPLSFNAVLKDVAVQTLSELGATVEVSDLYLDQFEPVEGGFRYEPRVDEACFSPLVEQAQAWKCDRLPADVKREIERLEAADLVIFQFPMWWHAQPAILKGWFDRVFVNGGLYSSRMRYDRGYFRGKRAVCSVTVGAAACVLGPGSRGSDIETLLWPIQYSLYYMGFHVLPAFVASGMPGPGYNRGRAAEVDEKLERYKREWERRVSRLNQELPIEFPGWDDWDEDGRARAGDGEIGSRTAGARTVQLAEYSE